MSDTPGQVAYEAFMVVHLAQDTIPALAWGYEMLAPHERAGWEAAAQAVCLKTCQRARAVVRHWHEFGPGDGFEETMHALETWLAQEEEP